MLGCCIKKLECYLNTQAIYHVSELGYMYVRGTRIINITRIISDILVCIPGARYRFGKTYGDTTREVPACADPPGYSAGKYITFPVV